jgi:hypothetical protein
VKTVGGEKVQFYIKKMYPHEQTGIGQVESKIPISKKYGQ